MDAFGLANTSSLLLPDMLDVASSPDDFAMCQKSRSGGPRYPTDLKAEGRAGRRGGSCPEDSCHAEGHTGKFHHVSMPEQEVSLHLSRPWAKHRLSC